MKAFKTYLEERCWPGYKSVPGKQAYSKGSCVKEEYECNGTGEDKECPVHGMQNCESIQEDWQKVNKADKTDGLSQAAVNAYRRENPGSKLQTAVTKDPSKLKKGSKDAKRRLSFCRRMRGMKNRLTNPENARDPDSPVNKALRRWNC